MYVMPEENICFSFLDTFLSFLKTNMQDAQPDDEVYEINFDSRQSRVLKLRKICLENLHKDQESRAFVVQDWFKEWLEAKHC